MHRCLFLVKDTHTSSTFWTQGFHPNVRPIKIFSHHLDVTKFLTFKNYLTNYSYMILSECDFSGMSVSDYRQFFKVLHATKNLRKHAAPAAAAILPAPVAVTVEPTMEMCAKTTARALRRRIRQENTELTVIDNHRNDDQSISGCIVQSEISNPIKVKRRRLDLPLPSDIPPPAAHDYTIDNDMLKFSNSMQSIDLGFQLLVKSVLPCVKISRPQFLIRLQLRKEGFHNDPLRMFARFLKINYPEFSKPGGLLLPVREFVSFHGMIDGETVRYRLSRDEIASVKQLDLEFLTEKDADRSD